MSLKLSLVLPCYNVERYIADCLDSIYAQNMSEVEFEVICVNDCSTDKTLEILSAYKNKHINLIIINHTINQTLGGARNSGLKAARGSFLWFVDPDDYITNRCLNELVDLAENKDADILMFNHSVVNSEKKFIKNRIMFPDSDIMSGQDYILNYTPNNISAHSIVWCCIYKSSFLHNNRCLFPIMRKGADDSFQWRSMLLANRVCSVDKVYYVYRVNPGSVSHKTYLANVVFSDRVLNSYQIYLLLNEAGLQIKKEIKDDLVKVLVWSLNSTLSLVEKMSSFERGNYYQEIVGERKRVEQLRPYMNKSSRVLYSVSGGQWIWRRKLEFLLLLERLKKK